MRLMLLEQMPRKADIEGTKANRRDVKSKAKAPGANGADASQSLMEYKLTEQKLRAKTQ